jgi:predicted Zn-ribbon and HTH transcriptional regulator
MAKQKEKKCLSKCPKCGSDHIDWGDFSADSNPTQEATCLDCGCEFQEVYQYMMTVWED